MTDRQLAAVLVRGFGWGLVRRARRDHPLGMAQAGEAALGCYFEATSGIYLRPVLPRVCGAVPPGRWDQFPLPRPASCRTLDFLAYLVHPAWHPLGELYYFVDPFAYHHPGPLDEGPHYLREHSVKARGFQKNLNLGQVAR